LPIVGVVLILCASSSVHAQSASSSAASRKVSDRIKLSPLERLKQRSPFKRWKDLSKVWPKNRIADKTAQPVTPANSKIFETNERVSELQFLPPIAKKQPVIKPLPDDLSVTKRAAPLANTQKAAGPSDAKKAALLPETQKPAVKLVQATQAPAPTADEPKKQDESVYPEPIRDPKMLKKLTSIMPYFDYEPDDEIRMTDACKNLCPRPDGAPCKPSEPGKPQDECPEEVLLGTEPYEGRLYADTLFQWKASDLYYNPLYFEDPGLERYGHTHGDVVQPFVSAGRFAVQLVGLPYQMTIDPVCKRIYTLGWYPPGDCAPKKYYQIPWNTKAAIRQGAIVTGLFLVVP